MTTRVDARRDTLIADDVREVFSKLLAGEAPGPTKIISTSPDHLRGFLERAIDREIEQAFLGKPASILLKLNSLEDKPLIRKLYDADRAGVQVLCSDLPVASTEDDRDGTADILEQGARQVIAKGAEVIILGCAGMSGLDQILSARLGLPVIDSVAAAIVYAEALVQLGKRTSKWMTYRPPEMKEIKGYPDYMQPKNLKQ